MVCVRSYGQLTRLLPLPSPPTPTLTPRACVRLLPLPSPKHPPPTNTNPIHCRHLPSPPNFPPNPIHCPPLQSLGWRTMLVVPELENELAVNQASHATQYELRMLRQARADVDSQLQRLEWAVACGEVSREQAAQVQAQLGLLAAEREAVKERYSRLLR